MVRSNKNVTFLHLGSRRDTCLCEGPRFNHKVSEHSVLVLVPRGPKTRHCCTILLAVVSGSNTHHGTSVTSISTYVYGITVENCQGVHQHSVSAPAQVMMMSRVPEAKESGTRRFGFLYPTVYLYHHLRTGTVLYWS